MEKIKIIKEKKKKEMKNLKPQPRLTASEFTF